MMFVSLVMQCEVLYAEQLSSSLQNVFPGELDASISQAMQTVVDRILGEARALVPVRTGFLLSTIGTETLGKWAFKLYARAPYAGYVELGTRRFVGRFYMLRAIEMHQGEFIEEVANAVMRAAEESGVTWIGG